MEDQNQSFNQLYECIGPRLLRYIARYDKYSLVDVGAICQDAWIKAIEHQKSQPDFFNNEKVFQAWIFKVARNSTIDWRRKKKATPTEHLETSSPDPEPYEVLERQEELQKLHKCIGKLPEGHQQVVRMRIELYNNKTIAKEVGQTIKRIYQMFHEAKAKLIACLEK